MILLPFSLVWPYFLPCIVVYTSFRSLVKIRFLGFHLGSIYARGKLIDGFAFQGEDSHLLYCNRRNAGREDIWRFVKQEDQKLYPKTLHKRICR
mmetsp:Transcript_6564/g.7506  ORF Transcript_6564/g.7506 Transcript_6564/m.7506 type:complete len:94 (-) Transcript_6564:51-332(-)